MVFKKKKLAEKIVSKDFLCTKSVVFCKKNKIFNNFIFEGNYISFLIFLQAIISFPGAPLYIPNVLKYRPVKDWLPREIVWTNL